MHKNMQKSLAGCTKNEKTPAETISAKKFCRGYVKNICRDSRERLTYIVFDIRAILEGYYQIYEDCVNIGPRNGRDGAEWGFGHGR